MIVDTLRLMSVLILKNVKTEGPGTIEDFLYEIYHGRAVNFYKAFFKT